MRLAMNLLAAMSTTTASMILSLEPTDTKPGQTKGVPIYTTAALGINEGKVHLALLGSLQRLTTTQ